MTIQRLDEEVRLPFDRPAILSGDPDRLLAYMAELVNELQRLRLYEIHQRINLMLDQQNASTVYLGLRNAQGEYPDGTWRITVNENGELSREKKVSGTWTPVVIDDV